jgi:1-aminocyclopropane-1-carboxylate synthase
VRAYGDARGPETLGAFEDTVRALKSEGKTIRAVLLCNPQNPLGFCYPRETLLEYLRFVERHGLHLISDEIYALSIFDNPDFQDPQPFISILSIDARGEAGCDPARVHMLYGMSKDLCAAGLRAGGNC